MVITLQFQEKLLKIMRVSMYQAIIAATFVSVSSAFDGKAQEVLDKKITAQIENLGMEDALRKIEQAGQVRFMYDYNIFNTDKKITHNFRNSRLEKVLHKLLSPWNIEYEITSNYILLKSATENSRDKLEVAGQESDNRKVSGVVKDKNGEPVTGATIVIKGTTKGTVTDVEGNFSIEIPENSADAILLVSYLGYITQELPVGNQTAINIQLEEDIKALEDVVVVGYGQQKKTSVTGAISSITAREITELPVPSVAAALQGRAAGVSVTSNGAPGEAPIVRIRGNGSISANANPLYVIDGVPITDPSFMSSFDNKDIETLEVLKDASSSAIYGSRAANGVIIITTKKGSKDGKIHVNLDSYIGTQTPWKKLDLLNTDQYVQYATQLTSNSGSPLPPRLEPANFNSPIYDGATQTYAQTNTNWQDAVLRSALITQTQLSMSGNSEKSRFYSSAGYFKQDGTMIGTGYERGNFRINSDHDVSKRIKVGQTLTFAYGNKLNEQSSQGRSLIMHTIRSIPYMPIYDPTKNGGFRAADANEASDPDNPVKIATLNTNKTATSRIFGTVFLEYKITDWLKFKTTEGLDYANSLTTLYNPIYFDGYNGNTIAFLSKNNTATTSVLFSNQLSFNKTFGKHTIEAIAVAEQQSANINNQLSSGNSPNNNIEQLTGFTNLNASGRLDQKLIMSYVGRLNYEFAGKYLLGVSFRSDGASNFAPGHKWGTFPAASIGWRISEENFMKKIPQISEMKIRASYGLLGYNQGIGAYDWQAIVNTDTKYGNGNNGAYFNSLPNPNLGWETSKMANIGIDLSLLNNKLTFTAEYFNKNQDHLILAYPIPYSIGYNVNNAPPTNVGGLRNWGFEFQAGYNVNKGGFKSNLSANLSIIRNEVTSLATPGAVLVGGNVGDYGGFSVTQTQVGLPIQSFYGWQTNGIIQSQAQLDQLNANAAALYGAGTQYQPNAAPGDILFKDTNGDGVINDKDRVNLGSYLPDFTYGLNYTASYKNFDISLFFQGVQGNKIYNGTKVLTQGMLRLFNAGTDVLNAWTPTNTNTTIPRAIGGDPNHNTRTSDRFLENGSYLRLKNVIIGYTIPEKIVQSITKGGLTKVRLYIQSSNLITITSYSGYDPEVGNSSTGGNTGAAGSTLTNGVDYGQAPQSRSFMGGIQIGF